MTEDDIAALYDPTIPKPPPRPVYTSPCECGPTCINQFRHSTFQVRLQYAYKTKLEDSQAISIAADHLSSIKSSLAQLQTACGTHGKMIASRWKKKSQDKRANCLFEVEPNLELEQWLLPNFSTMHPLYAWEKAQERHNSWLLNWLNVESLMSDPARLLGLLKHRTQFAPEAYGWNQGFLKVNYSPLCIVMHGAEYGSVVPWDEAAAHRMDTIGFPRGEPVLQAQDMLLKLLCLVVSELTIGLNETRQNLEEGPGANNNTLSIQKLDFKRSGRIEMWSKYINQPFAEPPSFDVDAYISMAQAMVNNSADHVWLLQTDPAYMRRTIRTFTSIFPDQKNKIGGEQESYVRATEAMHGDVMIHRSWKFLLEDLQNLKGLQISHPKYRMKYEPNMILAFLDEYLATCPKEEKARVDERLFEQLSEYTALYEIYYALTLRRPRPITCLTTEEIMRSSSSRAFAGKKPIRKPNAEDSLWALFGENLGLGKPLTAVVNAHDKYAFIDKKLGQLRLERFDAIHDA
ncbi:hypothetical protein LSUE1_G009831 [Lachnellula suecica]|uniref:Uncharacterized protein n=1 Tax=Lachnellula suecica TaxID=602035 RepID=A0A8T9BWL7_9HELO|nr:hypothetical protein LSUE1_G009831 [Lachnellula suecica]